MFYAINIKPVSALLLNSCQKNRKLERGKWVSSITRFVSVCFFRRLTPLFIRKKELIYALCMENEVY
jgi:hypothetical protein